MTYERSKPLHNFQLPSLKWGNQRFLRCMKVDSNGDILSSSPNRRSEGGDPGARDLNSGKRKKHLRTPLEFPKKKKKEDSEDGVENLLLDFRAAAEDMKISVRDHKDKKSDKQEDESRVGSAARPCNLRTRRAACRAPPPVENGGGSTKQDDKLRLKGLAEMAAMNQGVEKESKSLRWKGLAELAAVNHGVEKQRNEKSSSPKSLRLKGLAEIAAGNQGVEKERRKFSVSLDRDEIKDDLLMMTGSNPSRRPKKRARIIQKKLNNLFPGFWLSEVTTDSYRVHDELAEAKKN